MITGCQVCLDTDGILYAHSTWPTPSSPLPFDDEVLARLFSYVNLKPIPNSQPFSRVPISGLLNLLESNTTFVAVIKC